MNLTRHLTRWLGLALACGIITFASYCPHASVAHPKSKEAVSGAAAALKSAVMVEGIRPDLEAAADAAPARPFTALKGTEELPQPEQASLWQAFSEARRQIRALTEHQQEMPENAEVRFFAQNPGQQLVARFKDDGVRLGSGRAGRDWAGTLSLAGSRPIEIRHQGTQLEYAHGNIVEFYDNRPEGLMQGWILGDPNSPGLQRTSDGLVKLQVSVDGLTVESLAGRAEGSHDLQFVNEAGEPVVSYSDLKAWDANGRVLGASMHPTGDGLEILVADAGASYPIYIDPLILSLEQKLTPSDGATSDSFGYAVSIDGNTALIGATGDGSVYVFVRSGMTWSQQQKLIPSDGAAGNAFGFSVSLDGNTALVGAHSDLRGGSAYVFVRSGMTWSEQQKLVPHFVNTVGFGNAVCIDGDTALVGADFDSGYEGRVWVFVRSGATWSEQDTIKPSSGDEIHYFGASVSLEGDIALIGAPNWLDENGALYDGYGAAFIFERNGTNWVRQQKLVPDEGGWYSGFGRSVSLSGNTALIGRPHDVATPHPGSAYVYVYDGSTWSLQQKIFPADSQGHYFGHSVSLDGDTALVGGPYDDVNGYLSGSAYVFVRDGTTWSEQQKLTPQDGAAGDFFGWSVSLSSDTALVGAWGDDVNGYRSGSAYVFTRSGTIWGEQQKFVPAAADFGDRFGHSVSIDGDTALIGAHVDNVIGADSGSAYVFTRSGTIWSLVQRLVPADGAAGDYFGGSVSLDGDTALVGATGDDDFGSAYVFTRSGTIWSEQQKLTSSDGAFNDAFGVSVSVDGNTALVGASGHDANGDDSGSAYVFVRSGTTWDQQQKLVPADGDAGDAFGVGVSLDSDTALVGAYLDDDSGLDSGSAYVFVRSGNTWGQQQKLIPADGDANDRFGVSVSVDGNTALIGASGDDVNGEHSGSAYVFVRSGTTWTQQQKLIAVDGAASDLFGSSVCLSGDTAMVGAPQDDDNGNNSGSAYVFARSGTTWNPQQKLIPADGAIGDEFGVSVSVDGNTALVGADAAFTSHHGSSYVYRIDLSYTITLPLGMSAIANHLDQGGNTLAEVFPTVPNGTQIYKWDYCSSYTIYTKGPFGWSPAGGTLAPGEGAYILNLTGSPLSITFTGQPHDPVLPLPLPCAPGPSLVSAQTVVAADFETIVGQPPNEGAEVRRWNPVTQDLDLIYTYESGAWLPSEPIANIGESVWITQPSAPPALSVSPTSLSPGCTQGEDAASDSFEVWNSGGGTLSYTVSESISWLSCSPTGGSSTGEQDTITVNYSTAGLAPGTYNGTITVTAAGASGSPQEVAVTLTVLESEPVLAVSPTTLQSIHIQGSMVGSASFEVWNSGGGTLSYTVSDDADWLDCSPTGGDSAGEHDGIVVFCHSSGLEVGKYYGIITVTAAGAAGSPQTVLVEQLVTPRPRLHGVHRAVKKKMALKWRGGAGIHLEKTSSLDNPDWSPVPESEGVSELEVPTEDSEAYYRVVITAQAMFITQQPASVAVAQGDPTLLSVEAISLMPLSYQWLFHGTNLPGCTNETLSIPNVQPAHVGDYLAVVSNSAGSITSSPASVVITAPLGHLVRIPTNTFVMGSPASEADRDADEGPETTVTLTHGFWMGTYEVTQEEYVDVMGSNPSHFTGDLSRPVEFLSWADATNYCATLTQRERTAGRITASQAYRLPTEAEWEHACRAGTTTRFSFGDDPGYTNLTAYAWYSDNSSNTTHPVGQRAANPWGLHDLHGNVWEWCLDWYASYPGGSVTNPTVDSVTGTLPIVRGGSYYYGGAAARSANRGVVDPPTGMRWDVGLRVVLAPTSP